MKALSAMHRIYLLYRQSQTEESMISFIRDKLLRKGCSVVQDVTQSTMVLVLLTPGVFEFIDAPDDKVCNELVYVLRRYDQYRVLGILCDLFKWPDSIHLPDELLSLKSCDALEWSPENRNAFMKCLLEQIDPSLLDLASCPTSPRIIYEDEEEAVWNGGEGRNGVSTQAQNEEEVEGNFRRTGSAFYFDELNEHVERKSEVPVGRKPKPKISGYPALGSPSDQGRLEETSDDTDPEESYEMEAYKPPELPESVQSSATPVSESQAYRPPELPTEERSPNAESDSSEHAIASPAAPYTNGDVPDEPDSHVVAELRRKRTDTYEPPELPLDEAVPIEIEKQRHTTPSPNGATATIRPRSGDKRSIYVPPPSPPSLDRPENGEDETDAIGASSRSSRGNVPPSGTTTVVIERRDPEGIPGTSQDGTHEDQVSRRSIREPGTEPERRRPQSQPPPPRSSYERGVDTAMVPQSPYRNQGLTPSSSRGSPSPRPDTPRSEKKSALGKFFHRKTFKLPKDSEIRYGRYADEHPYWNAGKYTKYNLDDEFCDESYFANKRNTLPRISVRVSRRNSHRLPYSEPERPAAVKPERAASVTVLDETRVHRFVPEVEPASDEPSEHVEARKKDAGSTPVSERKTYEPVEEYRPPAEPEFIEAPVAFADENPSAPPADEYEPPAEPKITAEIIIHREEPRKHIVDEYQPPEEPQLDRAALDGEEPLEPIADSEEPKKETGSPERSPSAYEVDTQIVRDYVVLPPPQQHIMVNYPKTEENVPLQEIEPLVDQKIYVQQLLPPRRLPPLVKPSELTTTVPDVRMAAQWTQVEINELQRQAFPVTGNNGGAEYQPPPLPTTEVEAENGRHRAGYKPSPAPRTSQSGTQAEVVQIAPAVIRRYQPPEPPAESSLKSEPIAYREPIVEVESKLEPLIRREIQVGAREPRAHEASRESYTPPPIPEDVSIKPAQRGELTVINKSEPVAFRDQNARQRYVEPELEPQVVIRRLEPILNGDTQDGASFSKQNIKTDPSAHTRMDPSNESTVVGTTRFTRPIALRRPLHPEDASTPFTPPNSFTETEATIHENFRRARPLIYHEPPMPEPEPASPPKIARKPAIPKEFSRSLLSAEEDSYQPPLMPIAPVPESTPVAKKGASGSLVEQRKTEPIAQSAEKDLAPSSATVTTFYPSPIPLNGQIEDKDKTRASTLGRKTQAVAHEQASRSRKEPSPAYVPPRLPVGGDVHEELKGSPVAFIKPPPAYTQNNSNDGDDEEEEDTRRRGARNEHRKPVKDSEAQLCEERFIETSHVPKERRTKSVIEVSQSTMEPVLRRRVHSLDPRLTRDLREYVERHSCDRNCCKVVCPKRLAENIDNLHYVDDVRILTNLDVLGRRRLSYLLAVEAQRYVSYLDSKFISAAGTDEGSKTPDSGCDPSSKVSGGDSDATLSDGEFVSDEAVARELAKIEKIRQRNAQFQENGVIPPPHGFGSTDRHQVYQSAERAGNKSERSRDSYRAPPYPTDAPNTYQPPPLPPSESGSVRSHRSVQAQDTYRRPELPIENVMSNQNTYRAPPLPSGYESPNGIPSNPAAREAMKNIIEGRIVFEPHSRRTASSNEPQSGDAEEAYNTWRMIWKNVKLEEVPALSGHEILSLFGVMRHILGTKSSLTEVRNDLRTLIENRGMGLKR